MEITPKITNDEISHFMKYSKSEHDDFVSCRQIIGQLLSRVKELEEENKRLKEILDNPDIMDIYILRTWKAEDRKRIALHLLGDKCQRCNKLAERE